MVRVAFLACVAGAAAMLCARPARAAGVMLEADLSAKNVGETVVFTLTVTNRSDRDAPLRFTSAARIAVLVCDSARTVIWDSAAGRMFAAVMSETIVPAGESRTFSETWTSPPAHGTFFMRGTVRGVPPIEVPERTFTR